MFDCLFVCFSSFYSSLYVSLSFNSIAYFGLIKTVQFYIRTKFTCCKTMHNTIVLITFPCIELPIEGKNYQESFFFSVVVFVCRFLSVFLTFTYTVFILFVNFETFLLYIDDVLKMNREKKRIFLFFLSSASLFAFVSNAHVF